MEASTGYQTTVDADTFHPRDTPHAEVAEQPAAPHLLALPQPPPSGSGGSSGGTAPQTGPSQTLQMDHLGPMVIGSDGTISRISNWDKLNQREQEVRGPASAACLPSRLPGGVVHVAVAQPPSPPHLLCLCRSLCGASLHAIESGCSGCGMKKHRLHRAVRRQPQQRRTAAVD